MCILLMICIIGVAFLLGGLLFSRSVSTILQLVVASEMTANRLFKEPNDYLPLTSSSFTGKIGVVQLKIDVCMSNLKKAQLFVQPH